MKYKNCFILFVLMTFNLSLFGTNETDSLKNCLLNEENTEQIIDLHIKISQSYIEKDLDSSIHFIDKAYKIQKENNISGLKTQKKIAKTYILIARTKYNSSYYHKSDYYFNKALKIYLHVSDTFRIGYTYYNLAMCNKYWGKYREAVNYSQKGIEYFYKNNNKVGIADFYLLFGFIYHSWNNFERANFYCNKAFKIIRELDDNSFLIGYAYLLKGNNHFALLNTDSALISYEKALPIFKMKEDTYGISLYHRNLAEYHISENNLKQAKYMLDKSLDLFLKLKNKRHISGIYILRGKYFSKTGNHKEAIKWYEKGLKLSISMDLNEEIIKGYRLISEAYGKLNNDKAALIYYKLYNNLEDSIYSIERHKQIADMQTKYESQKKEQENIILKKELEVKDLNEQKNKAFQRYLVVVLAVTILVIGLLYILFRLRSKTLAKTHLLMQKEKQLATLEIKNKEALLTYKNDKLSSTILHLINKNETLDKIKKILISENNKTNPNYKESYKTLFSIINSNIDNDMDWKKFLHSFENIHDGFIDRLLEKHPNLSEKEQRLCVCLKINFSSQEISQMMNITTESVSKNRQRLRKKLNFNEQLDLKEYVQQV